MKTIGLLGGMSWQSTMSYYRALNEGVNKTLGGLHSARITLHSVDFHDVEHAQGRNDWVHGGEQLAQAARLVEAGGADFLLLCSNTMHKVAPAVENAVSIPLLHIADATAESLVSRHFKRVGLLGTQYTMTQNFYQGRLLDHFGLDVLIPEAQHREQIHQIIYDELCHGEIKPSSRQTFLEAITWLREHGAEAVILGCTEIALLLDQSHTDMPLYDSAALHAESAVRLALREELQTS